MAPSTLIPVEGLSGVVDDVEGEKREEKGGLTATVGEGEFAYVNGSENADDADS